MDAAHNTLATAESQLPIDYSPDTAIAISTSLAAHLEQSSTGPILGIGVALSGPVDRSRKSLTRSSTLPDWAGIPVLREFARRISYPVLTDNESNLAAYAEKLWGAATDVDSMIYLKLHRALGAPS